MNAVEKVCERERANEFFNEMRATAVTITWWMMILFILHHHHHHCDENENKSESTILF
jgi:hypothetical protein